MQNVLAFSTVSSSLSFHSLAKHESSSDAKNPKCYIAVVGVRVSISAYTEIGATYILFSNVKKGDELGFTIGGRNLSAMLMILP